MASTHTGPAVTRSGPVRPERAASAVASAVPNSRRMRRAGSASAAPRAVGRMPVAVRSNTSRLVFGYEVAPGIRDTTGFQFFGTPIELRGGSIRAVSDRFHAALTIPR